MKSKDVEKIDENRFTQKKNLKIKIKLILEGGLPYFDDDFKKSFKKKRKIELY